MSKWLKCVSVWFSSLRSRIVIQLSFNSISFSKGLRFRPNSIQAGKYGQSRLFIHSFPRPVRLCLFASIWQFPIEWSNSVRQLIRYKCFVVGIVSQFIEFIQFIQFEALRCKIYNRSFVKIFQKIAKSVCFRGGKSTNLLLAISFYVHHPMNRQKSNRRARISFQWPWHNFYSLQPLQKLTLFTSKLLRKFQLF